MSLVSGSERVDLLDCSFLRLLIWRPTRANRLACGSRAAQVAALAARAWMRTSKPCYLAFSLLLLLLVAKADPILHGFRKAPVLS